MDVRQRFSELVLANPGWLGVPIFAAAWAFILLPPLIAQTRHARAQDPPVPGFPLWALDHFRVLGYGFSRAAWRAQSWYGRSLLWLYRLSVLTPLVLGAVFVAASVSAAPA